MRIIVDVDDVVANLLPAWLDRYNEDYDMLLVPDDITDWDMTKFVVPACGTKIYDYLNNPTLYDNVLPVESSNWGVNELRRRGHEVIFVTANASEAKLKWLQRHGFIEKDHIGARSYVCCWDKSLIQADVIVDDRPKTVEKFKYGILFDRPHNRNVKVERRAKSWVDVIAKVIEIEKLVEPTGSHPTEISSPEQAKAFREIIEKMYQVHLSKNQDYSPANILGAGEIGLATRTWDKMSRLMNLMGFRIEIASSSYEKPLDPKNESIEDNLMDLATYSIIWQIYRQGKWGK